MIKIQRYTCITHNNVFNALDECVNQQMIDTKSIIKSVDIAIFDKTVITHRLYISIASNCLVHLNESHVVSQLKHTYKRNYIDKTTKHRLIHNNNNHICDKTCYGLQDVYDSNLWIVCIND